MSTDPESGKVLKQGRIRDAIDKYYSSPVAADGKIYVGTETGKVSVLRAGKDWELLTVNDLEEDVYATPALAGDRIYLRTSEHLYCFALHDLVKAVRGGDVERARVLLARGGVPGKTLDIALLEATEAKADGLTTLLREAGAATAHSDEQPVVPEKRLAAYAGHFQTEKGWKAEIILEDGVLVENRPRS